MYSVLRGQRPVVWLPLLGRRHRDQHPVQDRGL